MSTKRPGSSTTTTRRSSVRRRAATNLVCVVGAAMVFMLLLGLPSTGAGFVSTTDNTANSLHADTLEPPTALTATGSGSVTLDWTATTDTYADGHRILRSATPGGPYAQVAELTPAATTSYVDNPGPGTYYYVAVAFAGTWESAPSTETTAAVPSPPISIADSWQSDLVHIAGSGTNRMLVLVVSNEQLAPTTPALVSVTYGGQPLTHVVSDQETAVSVTADLELWILDEAGIAAAVGSTIAPVWSLPPDTPIYAHAIFDNVDQAAPIGATTTGTAVGDSPNPVPMAPLSTSSGDVVIAGATSGAIGSFTPQNGFTLGLDQTRMADGTSTMAAAYKSATGADETVSMFFNPDVPPDVFRQVVFGAVLNGAD